MVPRKERHWRKLWRRNLRDFSQYFETLRGIVGTTRALTYQPDCCCVSAICFKGPGEDDTEFYLLLFPFFGGAYLHLTCYLYSCPPCECEQHVQPLNYTFSVVMAASFSQKYLKIPCWSVWFITFQKQCQPHPLWWRRVRLIKCGSTPRPLCEVRELWKYLSNINK